MTDALNEVTSDPVLPKPWMRFVLTAAAVYNLIWGVIAIAFPTAIFRIAGISTLPNYPELWQCIGMIVGVYGVGYAIAARHPFIHWPIVLVGLLGKIFGPIGFLLSLTSGRLSAAFGWVILTNDLIWWIPFSLILWHAARFHQSRLERFTVPVPVRKIDPLGRMLSQRGASLIELSRQQPLLLVFLRHSGCTFCRESVCEVAAHRRQIESGGTQIAFVHMGQKEPIELLEKYSLTDLHVFRDPSCSLYDAFGLKMGSFGQLFGPRVWWRAFQAFFQGHKTGRPDGNVLRMPGVFLIQDGEIIRAYRHQSASDRPDYVQLATLPTEIDVELSGHESDASGQHQARFM